MTMMVVNRRRACKPSYVLCGMHMLPVLLPVMLILTVCCSMPTTVLGAQHCFHSHSYSKLGRHPPRGPGSTTDTLSGTGTGASTLHKHTTASCLSVQGGSFALPNTSTALALTRGGSTSTADSSRPLPSSSSLKATSLSVPSDVSAVDVDLPRWFVLLFGEFSFLLLILPIVIVKLILILI
jgi:hypothetical protein